MPELWQPIKGYEGLYEVSDQGRVKRLPHARCKRERILKENSHKYPCVVLCFENVRRTFLVHRLVAKAFVPGDHSLTVNHIDGNKKNNCADNLEWVTPSQQQKHAITLGLRPRAWGNCKSKLTPQQWQEVKDKYLQGLGQHALAAEYGVSQSQISKHLGRLQ